MKKKQTPKLNKFLIISVLSVCAGVFAWWIVTDVLELFRSNVLPSPVKVMQTFMKKWVETKPDGATLLQHLFASLKVARG